MTIYGTILPEAASIAHSAALVNSLTERVKYKIKILDWHRAHRNNNSLTARHFGIGRMTLYRWLKKFKRQGIVGLNEESRKPKRLRQYYLLEYCHPDSPTKKRRKLIGPIKLAL